MINEKLEILDRIIEKIKELPPEVQVEAFKFMAGEGQDKGPKTKIIKKVSKGKKKSSQKVSGIGLQIERLIQEGFFDKPKSMKEISERLIIKGFNIKLPYLSPQLLKFVRNSKLMRHKDSDSKYVYHKNNHVNKTDEGLEPD